MSGVWWGGQGIQGDVMGAAFVLPASFSSVADLSCSFVVPQAPHHFPEFQPEPDKNRSTPP